MNRLAALLSFLSITFAKAQNEQNFYLSAVVLKRMEIKSEVDGKSAMLFSDDQVELTDYIEKGSSKIFEFYYNGEKHFTDRSNIWVADSTFSLVKSLNGKDRESARNQAKQYSKYCYDLEIEKAIKYYNEAKDKGMILINSLDQNGFDPANRDFEFEFFNTSQKTITKIQLSLAGYGDESIQTIVEAKIVIFDGNVKGEDFGYKLFKNVWKNKKLTFKSIASIKIDYSDGSSEVTEELEYLHQTYLYFALGRTYNIDNKRNYLKIDE